MEGIIKSISPFMKDGKHDTWKNPAGLIFYRFNIEIGDYKGIILSSKQEPSYKVGNKVSVEMKVNESGNVSFKGLEFVKDTDQKFKSTYNTPEKVLDIVIGVSQRCAREMYKAINETREKDNKEKIVFSISDLNNYANYYAEWIIKEGLDRDTCAPRWNALELAISLIPELAHKKEEVCAIANELINGIKSFTSSHNGK